MKKLTKTLPISIFVALLLPIFFVFGATFTNVNELKIEESQVYQDNSYFLTGKSNVSGVFEKDLFIVAGDSNFTGKVKGDLFVIGGKVNLSGEVDGDVRVIGGEVLVDGDLENDLVVIGGKVQIQPTSQIKGQALFVGGETFLYSPIINPVKIISAKTLINSEINSEVEITTQQLILGNSAKIKNGITYYAPKRAVEENGSVVIGQVNFNQITPLKDISFVKRAVINFVSFWLILKFVTTLLIAFILAYIFRIFTKKVTDLSLDSFGKSLLCGILIIVIIPLIIALLILSLIAFPIAILISLIFISLLIIIPAISGIVAGALIRKIISKKDNYIIDFSTVAIGVVALTFISFVPYLGDITKILLNLVAIGAVGRHVYRVIFKIN